MIVSAALQDKKSAEENLVSEKALSHEYALEVGNWAQIVDSLSLDVAQLKNKVDVLERRNRDLVDILRRHDLFYALPDYHFDEGDDLDGGVGKI